MRVGTRSVRAMPHAPGLTGAQQVCRDDGRRPATRGAWRLARGAVVGVVATGLAWAGHVWAGGVPPAPWLLLIAALGVAAASVALSRYRWAPASLLILLVAAQALLHELFDQANPAVVHPAGHQLAAGPPTEGAMTLAHVLAAAATAWVLARGEDWLWLLVELLALRATRLLRPVQCVVAKPAPAVIAARGLPSQRPGLGAWSLRGPPVVSR